MRHRLHHLIADAPQKIARRLGRDDPESQVQQVRQIGDDRVLAGGRAVRYRHVHDQIVGPAQVREQRHLRGQHGDERGAPLRIARGQQRRERIAVHVPARDRAGHPREIRAGPTRERHALEALAPVLEVRRLELRARPFRVEKPEQRGAVIRQGIGLVVPLSHVRLGKGALERVERERVGGQVIDRQAEDEIAVDFDDPRQERRLAAKIERLRAVAGDHVPCIGDALLRRPVADREAPDLGLARQEALVAAVAGIDELHPQRRMDCDDVLEGREEIRRVERPPQPIDPLDRPRERRRLAEDVQQPALPRGERPVAVRRARLHDSLFGTRHLERRLPNRLERRLQRRLHHGLHHRFHGRGAAPALEHPAGDLVELFLADVVERPDAERDVLLLRHETPFTS